MRLHLGHLTFFGLVATLQAACGDDPVVDAGTPDSGVRVDANIPDTGPGPVDSGLDATVQDTGPDAGPDSGVDSGIIDIKITGLSAPVEVRIDDNGITHLRCETDEDCFAAEGYYHASHRFGQMDVRRRFPQGRLAEVFGLPAVADIDADSRRFVRARDGSDAAQRMWDTADTRTKAAITAYTQGVNAFLADMRAHTNGARLSLEWAHLEPLIADWTELDSVYCVLALAQDLTDQSGFELQLGQAYAAVASTVALDLFGLRTGSSATTIPDPDTSRAPLDRAAVLASAGEVKGRMLNAYAAIASALEHVRGGPRPGADKGSNNWAVRPSQTSNNKGLLSNDPHLGMDSPSVWYLIGLDSKTTGTGSIHVAGASFAGFPGILLGQNEDLAWGGTVAFFDLSDVYLETLNAAGTAVIFNGNEVPLVTQTFTINIQGAAPRQITGLYVPHHGPIVSIDRQTNTAVSIRWVGHDADTDLNLFYKLWTATNVSEARTALLEATSTGQNWVVTDRAGNIGWFPYSRVPNRPWASAALPPWLPLPGDGSAEWQGYHPYNELPQLENPTEGFIATANNDMTGALFDGDPTNDGAPYWQSLVDPGYREERVKTRLMSGVPNLDLAAMQDIQSDIHLALADQLAPHITAIADPIAAGLSPEGAAAYDAIRNWDHVCPSGLMGDNPMTSPADPTPGVAESSAGCAAFHAFFYRLNDLVFSDELAGTALMDEQAREEALIVLLTRPTSLLGGEGYWDDVSTVGVVETPANVVSAALQSAGTYLTTRFTADPDTWLWGKIHTVTMRALLFPTLGMNQYNDGPFANDGGLWTIDVANPSNGYGDDYQHRGGPSMRFSCETDIAAVACTIELPGGNQHFRNEPFRNNLIPKWLHNEPVSFPFTVGQVDAAAIETISVTAP